MSSSKSNHQKRQNTAHPPRSLKRALLLTGVSGILVMLVLFFVFKGDSIGASAATETETTKTTTSSGNEVAEISRVIGRWSRTDGGYILEIRSATPEGKLDVGYFNPNPINVARAEWVQKDGKLYVMAELQDVNYPGSTYGLEYIVAEDRLSGTYFQAVEKSTYDVQFVREK